MFFNNMNDYYKILNVSNNATDVEIKKQYRKLSLQYHPDRNNGNDEKFKEINEAFETLSDSHKRRTYDVQKRFSGDMDDLPIQDGIESLFNMFLNPNRGSTRTPQMPLFPGGFGRGGVGGGSGGGPNIHFFTSNLDDDLSSFMNVGSTPPEDIEKKISITLQQAYFGCNIPVEIKRSVKRSNEKYSEKETIYIDVPKGVDNNEKIVIKNKGNVCNQQSSNVNIFVSVKNNEDFIREGLNLIYEKNISFKESLCGFSFVIKHLGGKEFKLNSKSGDVILHMQEKCVSNLGMLRNEKTGNLIIRFKIIPPNSLNAQQLALIEKIF